MTLCAVCLFFVSAEYALTGAAICAIIAVALVWFAPGLSTAWKVSSPAFEEPDSHEVDYSDEEHSQPL
ncbi:hypothetical protein [uncultured Corynebacterium sp.]|nr:hypothetical protein [uncultured Corynebacterium sp.]